MGRASSQMKEHFIASFFGYYGPSCLRALAFLFLNLLSSTGRSWLDWLQYWQLFDSVRGTQEVFPESFALRLP